LARLRQRYALHFYMPEEAQAKAQHSIRVDLSTEARIRFPDAEVRSRRVFMHDGSNESSGPTVITRQTAPAQPSPANDDTLQMPASSKRRHVAVNEDSSGPAVNTIDPQNGDAPATPPQPAAIPSKSPPSKGGWPRIDSGSGKP
jgi:hypothetical protein